MNLIFATGKPEVSIHPLWTKQETSDTIKILEIQLKNDQVVFETICPQRSIGSKHEVAASAEDLTQTDNLLQLWPQTGFDQMFLLTHLAASQKPLHVNQVFGGHASQILLQISVHIAAICNRQIQPEACWRLIEPPGMSKAHQSTFKLVWVMGNEEYCMVEGWILLVSGS